ncbi:uncharacterized protein FA14DRAFT_84864 [Meira miltonrushii]|uniref:Uncharacterized protein n=1 Tax=Meira miltonrushii TaxID=1280837 RepID=A0A316V4B8_9BASI|nr:uncharacterized protein FA14DRAFT_84864 [Meira miltonrushii]PWN32094.1 hypothetical protein FA14DRAFT_84864 [Meira miltonrushii]
MSAALPLLSPLVTRILELKGFPAELKTRDIQTIFAQWENERGGFKIKWIDDITVLVIFSDPICAKRAYLQVLMSPPPMLMTASGIMAKIRPYDGDDAGSIISSVQNRPRSRSNAGGQATPAYGAENEAEKAPGGVNATPGRAPGGNSGSPRSVARSLGQGHRRNPSGSNPSSLPPKPLAAALWDASNGGPSPAHHLANALAAEGSPEKAEEILASINANTIRSPPSAANSTAILEPSPEIRKAEQASQALGA